MIHLLRLFVFAVFVCLAIVAQIRRDTKSASLFIAFVLLVSFAAGISRRESWPFATWALVSGRGLEHVVNYDFEVSDASGRWQRLDPRVWQPASDNEVLDGWLAWHLDDLRSDPSKRAEFFRFVLDRAEKARLRVRRGEEAGVNGWLLRWMAAPYAFQRRALWTSPQNVPSASFTAVRLIRETWQVEARYRNEAAIQREVIGEYRAR